MSEFHQAAKQCLATAPDVQPATIELVRLTEAQAKRLQRRNAEVAMYAARRVRLTRTVREFIRRCRAANIDPWSIGTKPKEKKT